jgi:hypothetical protein
VKRIRAAVLYASDRSNETLSYQQGWPRGFACHARFDALLVNLASSRQVGRFVGATPRRLDAVVLLHSCFSNEPRVGSMVRRGLARLRVPRAFFIGNEYKLMPEKMRFAEEIGVKLLVSQLSSPEAHALYRSRLGCEVVGIPNAGLDRSVFAPRLPREERAIDIGYRSYASPPYLGHRERQLLAEDFSQLARQAGFVVDASLDPRLRLAEREWAAFLNSCKAQLGSEAGGDYFELTEQTRDRVNAFLDSRPDADFAEVHARFFRDYANPVPGRAASSRIIEAAGTKTVQILLEGEYGGYFHPDVHYIPLRKDLANTDEVLEKLRDDSYVSGIVERAYEVACGQLTYERLIDRFADALEPLLQC